MGEEHEHFTVSMLSLLLSRQTSRHMASLGKCPGDVLGTSAQADLSHENSAEGAWSHSLSCVSEGEGMHQHQQRVSASGVLQLHL